MGVATAVPRKSKCVARAVSITPTPTCTVPHSFESSMESQVRTGGRQAEATERFLCRVIDIAGAGDASDKIRFCTYAACCVNTWEGVEFMWLVPSVWRRQPFRIISHRTRFPSG